MKPAATDADAAAPADAVGPGRPRATPWGPLLLALLLIFLLFWDLRAVLIDRCLSPTDSTAHDALLLQTRMELEGSASGLRNWMAINARKGPLPGLVVWGLEHLVGDPVIAARLFNVALHGLLLWMLCMISLRFTGRWSAGLLAVVASGAFAGQYGWVRIDYYEAVAAVCVVGSLWALLTLRSRPGAVRLGLVTGLTMLSKVVGVIYLVAPGLAWLVSRLRDRRRQLWWAALAATVALALAGWWLLLAAQRLARYVGESGSTVPLVQKMQHYADAAPAGLIFIAAGLAAAALAWRQRIASSEVLLLLVCCVGGTPLLLLLFSPRGHYLVPLYPVAGLLLGWGGAALLESPLSRRWPRVAATAAGLVLGVWLGRYVVANTDEPDGVYRVEGPGLVVPDPRPRTAFPSAVRYLRARGLRVVDVRGYPTMHLGRPIYLEQLWARRGYALPQMPVREALARLKRGEMIHLLVAHSRDGPLQILETCAAEWYDCDLQRDRTGSHEERVQLLQEIRTRRLMGVVAGFEDPDEVGYAVVCVAPRPVESR